MRPEWQEYFMQITKIVATRSTCVRRKVGAVLVKDNHILCSGYNGAPAGLEHCTKDSCLRIKFNVPSGERHELCRGLHAEQNAVIQAAVHGISIKGSTLYCTTFPCVVCAKILINAEIEQIVYEEGYPDELALQILEEAKVKIRKYSSEG